MGGNGDRINGTNIRGKGRRFVKYLLVSVREGGRQKNMVERSHILGAPYEDTYKQPMEIWCIEGG